MGHHSHQRSITPYIFVFLLFFASYSWAQTAVSWSDPASWPSGLLPQNGEIVTIPAGTHMVLDMDPPALGGIIVNGTLSFDEQPIHLTTDWIMVTGLLEIGTESSPHLSSARITLTGDDVDVMGMGMGGKFIAIMPFGQLELHGYRRDALAWTQLSANADSAQTSITVADAPNWLPDDELIIAPSGVNPLECDVVKVTSVTGNTVHFVPALRYDHYGQKHIYGSKEFDMRAEVGLLTRSILLEGDESTDTSNFGGHLMVMTDANAHVEGVEFYRMGQLGKQGRYPMHWHFAGERYGNYAKDNSVHHSKHRAFVLHGTQGVTLEDNVAYEIQSHAFVCAEDGNEYDNVIRHNLGVLNRRIPFENFAFPDTSIIGGSSQSENHPGMFWMKNPDQLFIDNHSAGAVEGMGFFFDGAGTATSLDPDFFTGNVAHSHYAAIPEDSMRDRYPQTTRGNGLFIRDDAIKGVQYIFKDFTSYKNSVSGIWMEDENQIAQNVMLADNASGAILMRAELHDAVIVGHSPNPSAHPIRDYAGVNAIKTFGRAKNFKVDNVAFYGLTSPILAYEDSIIGSDLRFTNISNPEGAEPVLFNHPDGTKGAIQDPDGSLLGTPNPKYVFRQGYPYGRPSCESDPLSEELACPMSDYFYLEFCAEPGASDVVGEVQIMGNGGLGEFISYSEIGQFQAYQFLPKNERFMLRFLTDRLPRIMNLKLKGTSSGNIGFMLRTGADYSMVLLDEFDAVIDPVSSISELNWGETSWFQDSVSGIMYLTLHADAANSFGRNLILLSFPQLRLGNSQTTSSTVEVRPTLSSGAFTFHVDAEAGAPLRIDVYSTQGRHLKTAWNGEASGGMQQLSINLSDLPSGMLIYTVQSGGFKTNGKLLKTD